MVRQGRRLLDALASTALGRFVMQRLRARRYATVLRRSGLVDEAHYRAQVTEAVQDVVEHYVEGEGAGDVSPHPLFDPEHYLATSAAARRSAAPPFVEFLDVGCRRGLSPHPLFDPAAHVAAHPEACDHPDGALGDFWSRPRAGVPLAEEVAGLLPDVEVVPAAYAQRAAAALAAARDRPGPPPGDSASFDHETAARLADEIMSGTDRRPSPLVSVVLPTRNRRDLVAAAISSVRAQTWEAWELVVVDDGGDDGTGEFVADLAAADDRIQYLWQEHSGVGSARNRGIAVSTGRYVAYLDSDNTWEPTFLEVMVGVLQERGCRAAHAASELHHPDGVRYRSRSVDARSLLARNHVDCITLVHERALMDEIGTFDETLERFVDWDLLLRMAQVTPLEHVPVIGTRYEVGAQVEHERLTTSRSIGWRDVVQARHLVDWGSAPDPVPGTVSVVVVLGPGDELPTSTLSELLEAPDVELLVADCGVSEEDAAVLRLIADSRPSLRVVQPPVQVERSVGRLLACAASSGGTVVLTEPSANLRATDVVRLAAIAVEVEGVVAPVLVGDDDLCVGGAVSVLATGDLARWGRGCLPDDDAVAGPWARRRMPQQLEVDAVQEGVVACSALLLRELGGPDPLFVGGDGLVDLARRAAARDRTVVLASSLHVPWGAPAARVGGTPRPDDRRELARRWASGHRDVPVSGSVRLVDDPGVGVPRRWDVGTGSGGGRRWVIATCVPRRAVAPAWGDWHFAVGLRDALRALGEHATIDTVTSRHARDLGGDDVHVLLRGVNPIPAAPGARNLLWVISHPSDVADAELRAADHVFAAGARATQDLTARGPDVTTLLQCTDPARFAPRDRPASTELLFVGNSRGRRRPALEAAAAAGLQPIVIGAGWEGLIPDHWIEATHVPNEDLPGLYARAGAVLNDHWEDMAAGGIVSNRVFDVVAAGGVVVSDPVEGLTSLFGDRVHVFTGPHDLPDAVTSALAVDRDDLSVAQRVRDRHSFAVRAQQLLAAAEELAGRDVGATG